MFCTIRSKNAQPTRSLSRNRTRNASGPPRCGSGKADPSTPGGRRRPARRAGVTVKSTFRVSSSDRPAETPVSSDVRGTRRPHGKRGFVRGAGLRGRARGALSEADRDPRGGAASLHPEPGPQKNTTKFSFSRASRWCPGMCRWWVTSMIKDYGSVSAARTRWTTLTTGDNLSGIRSSDSTDGRPCALFETDSCSRYRLRASRS